MAANDRRAESRSSARAPGGAEGWRPMPADRHARGRRQREGAAETALDAHPAEGRLAHRVPAILPCTCASTGAQALSSRLSRGPGGEPRAALSLALLRRGTNQGLSSGPGVRPKPEAGGKVGTLRKRPGVPPRPRAPLRGTARGSPSDPRAGDRGGRAAVHRLPERPAAHTCARAAAVPPRGLEPC